MWTIDALIGSPVYLFNCDPRIVTMINYRSVLVVTLLVSAVLLLIAMDSGANGSLITIGRHNLFKKKTLFSPAFTDSKIGLFFPTIFKPKLLG